MTCALLFVAASRSYRLPHVIRDDMRGRGAGKLPSLSTEWQKGLGDMTNSDGVVVQGGVLRDFTFEDSLP